MIDLNALLRRPVEYYEYPWAIERHLRRAQSYLRSLSQADDVAFVFCKSMPRSGHRFLTECVEHYLGQALHYCGFYNTHADCCRRIPCAKPHNEGKTNRFFFQKSHDFGFRDSPGLDGKYLIQYRSPIPRLQSSATPSKACAQALATSFSAAKVSLGLQGAEKRPVSTRAVWRLRLALAAGDRGH